MIVETHIKPRLRALEAFRVQGDDGLTIGLRDPSGLSDVMLSMSGPALVLLSLMDGEKSLDDIRCAFRDACGQQVSAETVQKLVGHLQRAHFLDGEAFDEWYDSLLQEYRVRRIRKVSHPEALGISDASGSIFESILNGVEVPLVSGLIRGVIAPHLDYPRGRPCYAAAYGALRGRSAPARIVVLGTNHFGRSRAVVTTGNDFLTPLGTARVDLAFLERLEERCGDLRRYEMDHEREHSIELQVAFLQHLFGSKSFTILPVLCPDPCGAAEAETTVGGGLREFAVALGELIAADEQDTLLVAGADLSHVGENFGDNRPLDDAFLAAVRMRDRCALEWLENNDPAAFVRTLAADDNSTRVCSAGCIFAIRTALPEAAATILGYHQAVDESLKICVTCAAVVLI